MENSIGHKKHILVVDDAGLMLRAIKVALEDDFHISLANSASAAFVSITQKKPDAILLDYEMPVQNGKEVLKKLREDDKTKDIPVFFLTGVSEKEKIASIMELKPQGYILKPIQKTYIINTLNKYFRKAQEKK